MKDFGPNSSELKAVTRGAQVGEWLNKNRNCFSQGRQRRIHGKTASAMVTGRKSSSNACGELDLDPSMRQRRGADVTSLPDTMTSTGDYDVATDLNNMTEDERRAV